jgi:hypothetical protein
LNDKGLEPSQQVERAYRIALSRAPKPEEQKAVLDFLNQQSQLIGKKLAQNEKVALPDKLPEGLEPARAAAFVAFCHVLLNSNEFMYIN